MEESKTERVGGGKEVLSPSLPNPTLSPFFLAHFPLHFSNYLKACYRLTTCLPSFPTFYGIYSYFKKVCRKKCTRQSRKVLWVAVRALFSKKFERMVREAMDVCLRVLKESNKCRFDSFSRYEPCIDHIPYYLSGLSRVHFFRQPFSKQLYST